MRASGADLLFGQFPARRGVFFLCPRSGHLSLAEGQCVSPRRDCLFSLAARPRLKVTMGRRKSSRKPPPKRKQIEPLDLLFNCPFCNHVKSCEVKLDRARNTGMITCTVCLEDYQTKINYLSEAVDVFNDWVDACEEANS